MDALALIHEAREAGLVLRIHDGALSVSGPKTAAPIVRRLKEHKADIVAALETERTEPEISIEGVCMVCGAPADDTNSNIARDGPDDAHYRRVHFDPPQCYDAWFERSFGRPPRPANLNRRAT